jgi:hypothetical protein
MSGLRHVVRNGEAAQTQIMQQPLSDQVGSNLVHKFLLLYHLYLLKKMLERRSKKDIAKKYHIFFPFFHTPVIIEKRG